MGFVTRALPREEVLPAAMAMAAEYKKTAPASVAITKKLLWEGVSSSVGDMMKREGPLFAWAGNQPDAKEGVMSFVEKREPQWQGSANDVPNA